MVDKIIKKYNVNLRGMIINGSIAVATMVGVGILFGSKNIMIAFPIALTSTVLGRQNFYVKPISKILNIAIIDLLIVIAAFISSLNIYSGIFINFVAIFLIIYIIVSPYDLTFYKPFIMLYIFTQYASISIEELPNRLLSVLFGLTIIFVGNFIKKVNEKNILGNSIEKSLQIIKNQLQNILNDNFQEVLEDNCSKLMRSLAYRIYITRHRKYLTTNLGIIQFKLYIYIEYLNLYIRKIYCLYINNVLNKKEIEELICIVSILIDICKKDENNIESIIKAQKYVEENKEIFINDEVLEIIDGLIKSINELQKIRRKDINKVNKEWIRSDFDKTIVTFKEYFNKDSIRFKFAMRMSITLTFSLLLANILGFYKVIWAVITIMSIMQPYYEDTIKNAKDRIKGNIIAIIFVGVFINIINIKYITITILIISLYLLYAFKNYYKISLFAAIASMCVSSLSENINELILLRVVYVIIGVVIVLISNNFIFPYKLKSGIEQLKEKIMRYDNYLIEESRQYLNHNSKTYKVRDLILHITLLSEKLYLRNTQYGDETVNKFIKINNDFIIKTSYKTLMSCGKKLNKEMIKSINCDYEDLLDRLDNKKI